MKTIKPVIKNGIEMFSYRTQGKPYKESGRPYTNNATEESVRFVTFANFQRNKAMPRTRIARATTL